jgi:purine-nucleoside phosphorylase
MPTPRDRHHGYAQALRAARFLKGHSLQFPQVGIVLGSGVDALVGHLTDPVTIPYSRIPHFPQPTVKGHAGKLHVGRWKDLPVAVLAGRVHHYEGYTPPEVVFPVRVLGLAGVGTLVITCAAGGIASAAAPGNLMVLSDHLNLLRSAPLGTSYDPRWGERFVDMSDAYDAPLRRAVLKAAHALRLKCFEGVYAAVPGPQYETAAEIRALKRLGADAVGMSTVPEVIAARQLNMRTLAIALITNRASGLARQTLRHDEVLAAGTRAAKDLTRLLDWVLPRLPA